MLLAKDTPIIFFDECLEALYKVKEALITVPLFNYLIEVFPLKLRVKLVIITFGVVFRQQRDKKPYVIYCASKMLDEAQENYTTNKKQLLVVVYAI